MKKGAIYKRILKEIAAVKKAGTLVNNNIFR
jgi:hypothetical protein